MEQINLKVMEEGNAALAEILNSVLTEEAFVGVDKEDLQCVLMVNGIEVSLIQLLTSVKNQQQSLRISGMRDGVQLAAKNLGNTLGQLTLEIDKALIFPEEKLTTEETEDV